MHDSLRTPLVRLGNLFPERKVYGKCEFLGVSGSFKIRGATHLLEHLRRAGPLPPLVVPSMGNTALGAAAGAKEFAARMVAVVPTTLSRAKDERLQSLGVELVKVAGGGTELLRFGAELAKQRRGYYVHPHLDENWTNGYQPIVEEILAAVPDCRTLVFPIGGGGLLMGLTEYLKKHQAPIALHGCEAFNCPTYAPFNHSRAPTIAEGLVLEAPHPKVQQRIAEMGIAVHLVTEEEIRAALNAIYDSQGLVVEPSSVVATAFVQAHSKELAEPIVVVLTGENITREDHTRLRGTA